MTRADGERIECRAICATGKQCQKIGRYRRTVQGREFRVCKQHWQTMGIVIDACTPPQDHIADAGKMMPQNAAGVSTSTSTGVDEARVEAIEAWLVSKGVHGGARGLIAADPATARLAELTAENERLRAALGELAALVRGECPSLLNEDSGGDAELSLEIDALLSRAGGG